MYVHMIKAFVRFTIVICQCIYFLILIMSFSCLTTLDRTCSTSGKSRLPYLVPDLRERASSPSPLSKTWAACFSTLYQSEKIPL